MTIWCPYCGKAVNSDVEEDGTRLIHGHQDPGGICGGSGLTVGPPRTKLRLEPTPDDDDVPAPVVP